jgi:hypothetical protein
LRSRIVSIGIPILLPDGRSLLRGPRIAVPPFRGANRIAMDDRKTDRFAHDGWVDLRVSNMKHWRDRMLRLKAEVESLDWKAESALAGGSSRIHRKPFRLGRNGKKALNVGEIVGWIFNEEEQGSRKSYSHPRVRNAAVAR